MDELIIEWPEPRVCVLRMNRPDKFNALSRAMLTAMSAAVEAAPDRGARVLVLAANGPGFCAGADLKERRSLDDAAKYAHNRQINGLANALADVPICTVAAIQGLALGGGLELALACDLRFAVEAASLGLTEARIGAIPGAGGTQRLPRLIGTARALQMMYSGEPVDAATSLSWGLVNEVTAPEALIPRVLAYARVVAGRSGTTASALKRVVRQGLETSLAEGLELERQAVAGILQSPDYLEGLAAFAEKRAPQFS